MAEVQQPVGDEVSGAKVETEASTAAPKIEIDAERLTAFVTQLHSEQRLLAGAVGRLVSAIVGALIWAGVTVVTKYQIGWMAVGVGFLVGIAVRKYGKGITKTFGVVGAAMAFFGCLLGNLLGLVAIIAQQQNLPILETEIRMLLQPQIAVQILTATFDPRDLLFYGIAIYEGYKFSFRQISQEELLALARSSAVEEAHG